MKAFVPAADEVWRLQHRDDAECRFFQGFMESGHYGGRTQPTDTRQGLYACTPSGLFLASINSTRPEAVLRMMEKALAAWAALPEAKRYLPTPPPARTKDAKRVEHLRPKHGLVLRVHARDLRPAGTSNDWRAHAWNTDFLWYSKAEVRAIFHEVATGDAGKRVELPPPFGQRIARFHLLDNVRGQTPAWSLGKVRVALFHAWRERSEGGVVRLRLEGRGETGAPFSGPLQGTGFVGTMLGWMDYDVASATVTHFELVAVGQRWGATRYNGRQDDLAPSTLGIAFTLAGSTPADRVAPTHGWQYARGAAFSD